MRLLPGLLASAAALLLAGCCGEERSINADVQLAASGAVSAGMGFGTRVFNHNVGGESVFEGTWDAVVRGTDLGSGQGVAITLEGGTGQDGSIAYLVLVLPTPLRDETRYAVGGAFPFPAGQQPFRWGAWGRRALRQPRAAEVGLWVGRYVFAPGNPIADQVPDFIATGASGTVTVTSDRGERMDFRLDLTATDAAGKTLRLQGTGQVYGERYSGPCT